MADRQRMRCGNCGYQCVPQWLNDMAHCLKCQEVLRRRPSCHDTAPQSIHGPMYHPNVTGTQPSHPQHGGTLANPGGVANCGAGGKCMFKFSRCQKCGRREGALETHHPPPMDNGYIEHAWGRGDFAARETGQHIASVFHRMDENGDGHISRQELQHVLGVLFREAGGCDEAKLDLMMQTIDVNHDGEVDYKEFANWVSHPGDGEEVLARMRARKQTQRPHSSGEPRVLPGRSEGLHDPRARDFGPERFFYDKSSFTGSSAAPEQKPNSRKFGFGLYY